MKDWATDMEIGDYNFGHILKGAFFLRSKL